MQNNDYDKGLDKGFAEGYKAALKDSEEWWANSAKYLRSKGHHGPATVLEYITEGFRRCLKLSKLPDRCKFDDEATSAEMAPVSKVQVN